MIYVAGRDKESADMYAAWLQRNGIFARPVFEPSQLSGLTGETVLVADDSHFYRNSRPENYAMDIAICNARRS